MCGKESAMYYTAHANVQSPWLPSALIVDEYIHTLLLCCRLSMFDGLIVGYVLSTIGLLTYVIIIQVVLGPYVEVYSWRSIENVVLVISFVFYERVLDQCVVSVLL